MKVCIALILACALCVAAPASGQPSAPLTGSVVDSTGLALAGVTITIRGAITRFSQTDLDGQFAFQDLPAGEYELSAALEGFATARRTVRVSPTQPTTVALTLSVALLEQSVVTAARMGEADVQATPMAISALSATELSRTNEHTIEQIIGRAPSLTFSQNTGYGQLTIRGIGTNVVFAGSDPSSAMYVDGVYLARPAMVLVDFLDLERVEVLRGPQGTLYGRNTVGGAVNVITKAPTNELETAVRVTAGDYGTLRAEGRVNGPIVRDRLMGSIAVLRGVQRGTVRDLDHPDHPLGGEDVTAARGQLRLVLGRRSELLVSSDVNYREPTPLPYAKVLAVKPGFQVDNPSDLHEVRTSFRGESASLQYGASGRFTFDFGPATRLTSLTAFRKLDYRFVADGDITELNLTVSAPHEIQHQVSEELTLAHQDRRVTWIGGVFLFHEQDRQPTNVTLPGLGVHNLLDPRVDASAHAVFGQATYHVSSRVSATAGLRFTGEHKTIDNRGRLTRLEAPFDVVPGSAYAYTDAMSHTAWTPKFAVEIRPQADLLTYVSATRGFKSGGFNFTTAVPGRGFAPEWAWSYEGGVKSTMAHGRARVNAAIFYTDYTDMQVQTAIIPGVIDISNAAAATIRGVEVESTVRLAPALQAGGHLAWLDATFDRYMAVGVGGVIGDVAGNRLTNAPEWSGRAWIEWSRRLGRAGALSLRADVMSQSTAFFTPFNDAIQRQPAFGLLNVSAEFGPAGRRWTIGGYVRNLTNQGYITGAFSSPPPAFGGRPGDPRLVGVQLTVNK